MNERPHLATEHYKPKPGSGSPIWEQAALQTRANPGLRTARKMEIEWFDTAATAAEIETADPLIDGLLDAGAMSVLYGDSNSGKTFVALDMAFHVATGAPWNNRAVKRGLRHIRGGRGRNAN